MAFGVFKVTREASLKIPEDIAITLYKNIDLCSYFDPQLTSVNVNEFNMGMIAADMFAKLIQDRRMGEIKVLLTLELIIRQSTQSNIQTV